MPRNLSRNQESEKEYYNFPEKKIILTISIEILWLKRIYRCQDEGNSKNMLTFREPGQEYVREE